MATNTRPTKDFTNHELSRRQPAATAPYTEGDTLRASRLAALPFNHPDQAEGRALMILITRVLSPQPAELIRQVGHFSTIVGIAMNHHDMVTFTTYALKLSPQPAGTPARLATYSHPQDGREVVLVEDEMVPPGSLRMIFA